jgi:hypothetical protein
MASDRSLAIYRSPPNFARLVATSLSPLILQISSLLAPIDGAMALADQIR